MCIRDSAGAVWLLDHLLLAPARARAATRAGRDPGSLVLPVTVDYARSFFPVAVLVLVVRSLIFEPFRIPSDSMMPTLLDGDFIIVNKFDYGLRLPVLEQKFLGVGEPQRGDVVVFHYPPDPAVNFIKRVVGLPGDRVRIQSDQPVSYTHLVLLLRSFIFEPFRIPSDSMMPTLLDGDFIIVNKSIYGLRWPVFNRKFFDIKAPQRGDVVVFRYPLDPSVNYIKRLVGLPGDHVQVTHDRVTINGKAVPFDIVGPYDDGCYLNMQLAVEHIGEHTHHALVCPVPLNMTAEPPPGCNRKSSRGYFCAANAADAPGLDADVPARVLTVPPGEYLMMGDNRDNSEDGRVWGFVPEDHLVGKATRIWFNCCLLYTSRCV